jgi:hypothetical protein
MSRPLGYIILVHITSFSFHSSSTKFSRWKCIYTCQASFDRSLVTAEIDSSNHSIPMNFPPAARQICERNPLLNPLIQIRERLDFLFRSDLFVEIPLSNPIGIHHESLESETDGEHGESQLRSEPIPCFPPSPSSLMICVGAHSSP